MVTQKQPPRKRGSKIDKRHEIDHNALPDGNQLFCGFVLLAGNDFVSNENKISHS